MLNESFIESLSRVYTGLSYTVREVTCQLTGLSHTESKLTYRDGMVRVTLAAGYSSQEGRAGRREAHSAMMVELRAALSYAAKLVKEQAA